MLRRAPDDIERKRFNADSPMSFGAFRMANEAAPQATY
jgi:hypothetical protein